MPKPQVTTPIYAWRLVREALSLSDIWNYWTEYQTNITDIETTVKAVSDSIATAISTALSGEGLGSNATKLRRKDTGAWEIAQVGVEYYAPDPFPKFDSGLIAQRFTGTGGVATTQLTNGFTVSMVVGVIGWIKNNDLPRVYPMNIFTESSGEYGYVYVSAAGNLGLYRGNQMYGANDSYDFIAIFKKA